MTLFVAFCAIFSFLNMQPEYPQGPPPPSGEEASADDATEAEADADVRATLPVSRQDDNIYVGF